MKDAATSLHFFSELGRVYRARFLRPLWSKYPDPETDEYGALALFLESYAFARQGVNNEFVHAACDTVRKLREKGAKLARPRTAERAWKIFSGLLDDSSSNCADNPLCPKGTKYRRKYRGGRRQVETSQFSVLEMLRQLASRGGPANIVDYARGNLEQDEVVAAYEGLCGDGGINGVGGRIASFFLREIAASYDLSPARDRHLLQPVDVWVRQLSAKLIGRRTPDQEVAKWVVAQAFGNGVSPEAVNQGMWYFGSQVAQSQYRASIAMNDLGYAKALVDEHIGTLSSEVVAWANTRVRLQ